MDCGKISSGLSAQLSESKETHCSRIKTENYKDLGASGLRDPEAELQSVQKKNMS